MADKIVKIVVTNGLIQVSPDPVYVSVDKKEQVKWKIDQKYDFDVEFAKAEPFKTQKFQGKKNKPAASGAAKKGTENQNYKYTVVITSDPTVSPLDPTVRPTP